MYGRGDLGLIGVLVGVAALRVSLQVLVDKKINKVADAQTLTLLFGLRFRLRTSGIIARPALLAHLIGKFFRLRQPERGKLSKGDAAHFAARLVNVAPGFLP